MKKILVLALLLVISACKVERAGKTSTSVRSQELKTHCVGRHLIELPSSFAPSAITTGIFKATGLSAQDPSIDIIVRAPGFTQSQFALEVQKRRDELKSISDDTTNIVRLDKPLSVQANLFRVQEIDDAYFSEINFLRGATFITVRLDSYEQQFFAAEESLIKFVEGIKATDGSISSAQPPGFCLGPIIITGEFKDESGSFNFRNGRGVDLGIEIETYVADDKVPLLARMSGPDSLLTKFSVSHTVLRARERPVAGMRGQEWLGWAELGKQQDEKTFSFALETMRPTPGKTTPSMHISFDSAQPLEDGTLTKTVMSDDEAVQLWDTVIESIRPGTR